MKCLHCHTKIGLMKSVDNFAEKNSKVWFLLKKIKDYEQRCQHGNRKISMLKSYEKRWKQLSRKYNEICIYGIEFVSIGETIPRLFMYLRDKNMRSKTSLHIVLPTFTAYYTSGIVNRKIFDVFGRHICFVTENTLEFWKYVVIFHVDKINVGCFDLYKFRDSSYKFDIELGRPLILFNDQTKKYAKGKMRDMGVKGEYICIHAREVSTKRNNFSSLYDDTSILDTDINTFRSACDYIKTLNYQIIRMGKDESKECNISEVIDYANCFYDELMDFYLLANCKFLLAGMAGIVSVAAYWGRPVLQTNAVTICYGQESLPRTRYDMYITKKFFLRKENRFLNLYEMLFVSYKCNRQTERYKAEGIEIYDNTEEEILKATIEMNEKLNHTWIESEEEKMCREKYWRVVRLWTDRHSFAYTSHKDGGKGHEMMPCPICYSYLKENMYLLDVEGVV